MKTLFSDEANPIWGSVLYVHMTEDLGFCEQQFGNVTSAFFLGSLLGSIGYGIYCRSVRLSTLLHFSIIAAVISNAAHAMSLPRSSLAFKARSWSDG